MNEFRNVVQNCFDNDSVFCPKDYTIIVQVIKDYGSTKIEKRKMNIR